MLSESSPDRGVTTYTHDAAGNVLTKTDARGKVATYTYDVLNRQLTESYADGETITFTYDTAPNGLGSVATMTDSSGLTAWEYSVFGEVTKSTRTILSSPLVVEYGYDAAGRMTSMTYPSGRIVSYTWTDHLVTGMLSDTTTIFGGATYEPFGPINGWTWGPGLVMNLTFDTRGLQTSHSLSGGTATLAYDAAGQLTDLNDPRNNIDYSYDSLGRLTSSLAGPGTVSPLPASQLMTYDSNGNRNSINENGTVFAYATQAAANRLQTVAGPVAKTFSYDAAGNTLSDGTNSYTYSDRGRVTSTNSGAVTYTYNGLGQRSIKNNGVPFVYLYDEQGQTIGEYNYATGDYSEHVYFANRPVALLRPNGVSYVHTDHLGTPRLITSGSNVPVWRWESDAFGSTAADEDPDGNGTAFTYNLRFPGQLYDSETGLHYNYFRTYDPATGRYLESDPIGLQGGLNTYGYANQNPLYYYDPTGEFGIAGAIGGAAFNFGFQLFSNLYLSGGDLGRSLRCVNLTDVAVSAAVGFIAPSAIGNVLRGKPGPAGLTQGQNAYLYFTRALPVGFAAKKAAPDARAADFSDDSSGCENDECKGLELTGALSEFVQ